MIQSNNLSRKTHYQILGVEEGAGHEEIRKAYRSVILNYHPDKLQNTSIKSNPEHEVGHRFLEVQRAWEILADPRSRALYDNELRMLRQDAITAEDVSIEDMTIEDMDNCFELSYDCRCGDCFSIDSSDLSEMGYSILRNGKTISIQIPGSQHASIILPCGSCSLKVRLLLDSHTTLQTERNG